MVLSCRHVEPSSTKDLALSTSTIFAKYSGGRGGAPRSSRGGTWGLSGTLQRFGVVSNNTTPSGSML